MDVGKTLEASTVAKWRAWLRRHHATANEIWLVYHAKASGKPTILYNDAVDEAVCFGWIDSIVKKVGPTSRAQRFTPRRKGSPFSEMNLARARRLVKEGRMTGAGLAAIRDQLKAKRVVIGSDVRRALQGDPVVWKHFKRFPEAYRRIRLAWIEAVRERPDVFRKRLDYFVKMTGRNKLFGMVQE